MPKSLRKSYLLTALILIGLGWASSQAKAQFVNIGTNTYSNGTLGALFPTASRSGATQTIDGVIAGGGTVSISSATVTLSGLNTYTGSTRISGGTLNVTSTNLPAAGGVIFSGTGGTLNFNQAANGTYAGAISQTATTSPGVLNKTGAGTLTLSGANSHAGGTNVTGGTLTLGLANTLGTGSLSVTTGTLSLGTFSASIGAVTLHSGSILGGGGVLTGTSFSVESGTVSAVLAGAGALVKTTTGVVTLSGVNTYAGGTTISAGTLAIGSSAQLGTASSGLTLNGGTLFNLTTSTTLARTITVSANNGGLDNGGTGKTLDLTGGSLAGATGATLTLSGAGTTKLAATALGSSLAVAITAGTVQLSVSGTTSVISNNFAINSSTLSLNTSTLASNVTLAGVITGNGTITFSGTGTLTLSGGNNTFTGTLAVPSGTLTGDTGSIHGNIVSTGTVAFNQAADGTFSGSLTGGGVLVKTGAGALTLANTTGSPLDLRAGSVFLGTPGGATGGTGTATIAAGALLGGNGTVGGTLVNAGTLSPGNSPGLINVTGNFSQAAGGKTIIELASLASFDQMVITGTATLNGTLQVTKLPGYTPALGDTFAILTAAGGVSGTFSSLTGTALAATGTAIGSTVSYGATTVTVAFVQLPLAGFALTSNQAAVAGAAQLVPGLVTALDAVPTGQLPAAFNVLSPQGYEVWSNIAFARATALATRLEREDDAVGGLQNAYFEGTERRGHTGGDGDVGRGTFTAYDGLLGDDRVISKSLVVGGLFGYGETTADLGSAGSRTTVRNYTVGLRAVTSRGPWFAHGLLAFGFDRYDATRPIAFTGTSAVASASVHGQQWTAALSGGREIMRGVWRFAPFGGVQATSWQADPFSETGAGALGSTLAGQSALSVRSQFGLEGEAGLRSGTWELFPRFRAAWLHEWDDNSRAIHTAFGAAAYSVRTRAPQRDSALLSVGFDVRLSPRSLIYTDFSAQTGDVTKIVSEFRAGLSVHF